MILGRLGKGYRKKKQGVRIFGQNFASAPLTVSITFTPEKVAFQAK